MKYDFKRIYTSGYGNWNSQMDEAGQEGFHVVAWMPWDGNHVIIMERASTEGEAFMREAKQ